MALVLATAQVLRQLFADSRRVADATGLLERAVAHLAALPSVTRVAILVHQPQPPGRIRARASHGLSVAEVDALGSAELVVPGGMRRHSVPLAATLEQVTLVCDGTTSEETTSLVTAFLALTLERDQAVTDGQRLGDLFNAGPVVIFRWRNGPGWPVEYVSPNVTKELGYQPERLVDQPYAPLVHPGDLERIGAEVAEAVARGAAYFAQQYRVFDADGQVRDVFDFTHIVRDAAGVATHFHGYVFDDGERARAQRAQAELAGQQLQSQKLQAVGTLASGIAHDFHNVLAAILAHLELARLEPAIADNADLIAATTAAMKGRDIVRQLLVFGRPRTEQRLPHRLQRIIEDSMGVMRSTIPSTIGLRLALDPRAPAVLADATQLQQVLVNLVTNAAHALGPGGTIDISLATRPGNPPWAELTVKDQGHGMTPEVLARAFEPFFTTRPVGKGTGLGLSMVHTIVRAHGGTVALESKPALGTTVVVSLPGVERLEENGGQKGPVPPGKLQRIALVDDEPLVARATERLVSHFGYEVTLFSSADEVLRVFDEDPAAFALVLTDQTMPGMTGLDLTRALRAKGVMVPVLLVTGLPTEIDAASVAPPFTVLGKPYRSEELALALSALLR
ncbi:MAG: ATP-binding protein [Archangium sp.]|nr:ATP-binding protein [Archangium sp.]